MGSKTDRLEQVRAFLGLNKSQMADLMAIKPNYYSHISNENGKGSLRIEHLEALLRNANVNPLWILTGEGEMFVSVSNEMHVIGEPTEEQIDQLYAFVLEKNPHQLTPSQTLKFKLACSQCFIDFPKLRTLEELSIPASVYLRFIVRLPKIDIIGALGLE